jgi:cation diffusion facilitator CzcD-associated flavoprotein CzcO
VAVVGAGIAGLACAKVLTQFGFSLQAFDRTPDVGGVWSATRRYPGLRTQNSKRTYHFSDHPMPRHFPAWPDGAQMQNYLSSYVERFGFGDRIRLDAEVVAAELDELSGRWTLRVRDTRTDTEHDHGFDHLVVANGIFSDPFVPKLRINPEFTDAGGRVCHVSELHELDGVRGRAVVVVGYGKSACDVAEAVSEVAVSTDVVARRLLWKMPVRLGNAVHNEQLGLTRLGEATFPYLEPTRFEKFVHGAGRPARNGAFRLIGATVNRQLGLGHLGLVPNGSFDQVVASNFSLATAGFYKRVAQGAISVHRDTEITQLSAPAGRPTAQLANGTTVDADVVICATGFRQRVPFFSPELQARLCDARGNFALYRQILPLNVPNLSFAGYNSSLISSLNAEVGALWIAGQLTGGLSLPSAEEQRAQVSARLRWMEEHREGRHARGTSISPFSIHNIDEMLNDLGLDVGRTARALQWVRPIRPKSYRRITRQLLEQSIRRRTASVGSAPPHDD